MPIKISRLEIDGLVLQKQIYQLEWMLFFLFMVDITRAKVLY